MYVYFCLAGTIQLFFLSPVTNLGLSESQLLTFRDAMIVIFWAHVEYNNLAYANTNVWPSTLLSFLSLLFENKPHVSEVPSALLHHARVMACLCM